MSYNKNKAISDTSKGTGNSAPASKKSKKKKGNPKVKAGARKKERDPRIRIAFGIFFMFLSLFALISTISYIIGYDFTGKLGETIGKYMSEYSFGIGSLYLILLLALGGSILAFKGPQIKITTICKYCLILLIWLPLFLATILPHNETCEIIYGLVGLEIYELIEPYIKEIGIYIVLTFFAFMYIIFTFDIKMPTINFDNKKNNNDDGKDVPTDNDDDDIDDDDDDDNDDNDDNDNDEDSGDTDDDNDSDTDDFHGINNKEDEDEDDDEDEDVEIIVKHIEHPKTDSEETPLSIELDPHTPSQSSPTDVDMEITKPIEEKQAIEIGQHFGLDTEFDPKLDLYNFEFPPLDLLKEYGNSNSNVNKDELEANKKRIVDTLANYNIAIDKIKATIGPTVTLYEIIPAAGVRISKIKGLQDDIALCLSAIGIRIIAPIPGKGTVGIEVPNQKPQTVSMKSVLGSERFQKCGFELPVGIGKTISNESYVFDLAKMPHILMAGATGQGKSVGINAIISSLLYSKHPAELKFVLVDPKKVELSLYKKIERHYLAKLPDAEEAIITDVRKVVRTLNSLCIEMDNRYELLKDAQVRNIKEYNAKFISRRLNPYDGHRFLPYIVLVVDEFADLIMTAGKEVEAPIARLAQLARAIGIHLIIATQRPSVNIITGTIKANFPARIAFRVISRVDSGTILDTNGADQLIGRGDMLLSTGNDLVRIQCAFIDTPEVEEITDFIGSQRGYPEAYNLPECPDEKEEGGSKECLDPDERDPLFEEAAYIIVQTQQGSTSMLQRKLKLGYNRAGRIIDQLEKAGIVGPFAGSKQREVKVANEMALEQFLKDLYNN